MFSLKIFKQSAKNNYKLWLSITALLSVFMTVVITMINKQPTLIIPGTTSAGLIHVVGKAFYGMMGMLIFLTYVITAGNKLVVNEVDNGDLTYTLNTPITRTKIIVSKTIFYIISILLMVTVVTVVGITASSLIMPEELDMIIFIQINLGLFLYLFAISGIIYLASCIFNKSNRSLMVGGGITIIFFLLNSIRSLGDDAEFVKFFTLNTLFDVEKIISGDGFIAQFVVLFSIGLVSFITSNIVFTKKDLPL